MHCLDEEYLFLCEVLIISSFDEYTFEFEIAVRVKKNAAKYGFLNVTDDKALEEALQLLSIKYVTLLL